MKKRLAIRRPLPGVNAPIPEGGSSIRGINADADSRFLHTVAPDDDARAAGELADLIQELTDQMHAAAGELQFELAARLRDEISGLKKELRQMHAATA